jgi:hypothetical protein
VCFPNIANNAAETNSQTVTMIGEPMIHSPSRIPFLNTSPWSTPNTTDEKERYQQQSDDP